MCNPKSPNPKKAKRSSEKIAQLITQFKTWGLYEEKAIKTQWQPRNTQCRSKAERIAQRKYPRNSSPLKALKQDWDENEENIEQQHAWIEVSDSYQFTYVNETHGDKRQHQSPPQNLVHDGVYRFLHFSDPTVRVKILDH